MRLAFAFADEQSPKLFTRDQASLARARSFSELMLKLINVSKP
jgi:hypothetical protein